MELYNSYQKFGVHRISNTQFQFNLFAPKAYKVSLIGEFNNWTPQEMTLDKEKIWTITINATAGQKYQYVITLNDGTQKIKTDPYSFSMDNIYSVIFDINNLRPAYQKIAAPNNFYNSPLNIYEIYLGGWNEKYKTYREIAQPLVDYLKKYSYNAVEFMPITEYPIDKTWGYQPVGFFAPTSRYGSPEDLIYLIDTLHENGIYVLLDWTPAHFDPWEYGMIDFDGHKMYEYPDERYETHPVWKTKCFNWTDPYIMLFLISSANFWLSVYQFDGLRIDTVTTILQLFSLNQNNMVDSLYRGVEENKFIRLLTLLLKHINPEAILIAEETQGFPGITSAGGLNFQYKQGLGWSWDSGNWIYADEDHKKEKFPSLIKPLQYHYENKSILTQGHDQIAKDHGFLKYQLKTYDALKVYYGYMMTFPGKKCLFMGNEYGQDGLWEFDKPLTYNGDIGFSQFVQELNKVYLNHSALYEKDYDPTGIEVIQIDTDNQVFGFIRHSNKEHLLCLCNFGNTTFENYDIKHNTNFTHINNIFSSHYLYQHNEWINNDIMHISIPALSFSIFTLT